MAGHQELSDEEWRATVEARLRRGEERFRRLERRAEEIEGALRVNNELTERAIDVGERAVAISSRTERKTDEVLERLGGLMSAVNRTRLTARLIGWCASVCAKALRKLAQWIYPILATAAALGTIAEVIRRWPKQ